jgi:hypothetical protein
MVLVPDFDYEKKARASAPTICIADSETKERSGIINPS